MADPTASEPFLPKISLRWLIGLVTVCAAAMGVVQQAVSNGQPWAVLTTVLIAVVTLPLLMCVATFSLASLFSTIGSAAIGPEQPAKVYVPATRMPDVTPGPVTPGPVTPGPVTPGPVHCDGEAP
ncbi:hypothetical protein [Stieleria maiorica]|nr:hypothetical protein [Stieleria maiorica]